MAFSKALLLLLAVFLPKNSVYSVQLAEYVIGISIDGLVGDYLEFQNFTNLEQIVSEGVTTAHARTDYDFTSTLPNHFCMLTSKPAKNGTLADGTPYKGHGYTDKIDVGGEVNSESVFDVVHDSGGRTALFSSKEKFAVFVRSWNASITHSKINNNTITLTERFIRELEGDPYNFAFLHFADPDVQGHAHGWLSAEYFDVVQAIDEWIGMVMDSINGSSEMRGKTAVIITSDHGGIGREYSNHPDIPIVYNVPFYVWGPELRPGYDLYEMNSSRLNPNPTQNISMRPGNNEDPPPIRNGDLGNLALQLLGLRPIQNSRWNFKQDLILDDSSSAPSLSPTVFGSYSYSYEYGSYDERSNYFDRELSEYVLVDPTVFSSTRRPPSPSVSPPQLRRLRQRKL